MKLVDILARVLTEWPCLGRKLCQGHKGHIYPTDGGDTYAVTDRAEDWELADVTRDEWQAAVDALKADEYHEPDNGVEAWLHGVERDYGKDAAQKCRAIIKDAKAKLDRSKACDEMFGIMSSSSVREGNRSDMAEALYDAGYRKFEIVDKDDVEAV